MTDLTQIAATTGSLTIPLAIVSVIAAIIYFVIHRVGQSNEAMKALAMRLGCKYEKPRFLMYGRISGNYGRYEIDIGYEQRNVYGGRLKSNKNSNQEFYIRLKHATETDGRMTVMGKNFLNEMFLRTTGDIVKFGDDNFDKKVLVSCKGSIPAKDIFDMDIRARLLQLKNPRLNIDGQKIEHKSGGFGTDVNRMFQIVELMVDIADRMRKLSS